MNDIVYITKEFNSKFIESSKNFKIVRDMNKSDSYNVNHEDFIKVYNASKNSFFDSSDYISLEGKKLLEVKFENCDFRNIKIDQDTVFYSCDFDNESLNSLIENRKDGKINLISCNIENVNLSAKENLEAQLGEILLKLPNLSEIDFENSKLNNNILTNCDFSNCNMKNVNLMNTDLTGSNLEGANLANANLRGTRFTIEQLSKSVGWDSAQFDNSDKVKREIQNYISKNEKSSQIGFLSNFVQKLFYPVTFWFKDQKSYQTELTTEEYISKISAKELTEKMSSGKESSMVKRNANKEPSQGQDITR